MEQDAWRKAIEDHYRRRWGDFSRSTVASTYLSGLPKDFGVVRIAPNAGRAMWTYATCGMAQPGEDDSIELHINSLQETDTLAQLLHAVARFHRTHTRISLGHSVNFGRPWLPGSACSRGLISLPYLEGVSLEKLTIGADNIRCLWLIPITPAEVKFKIDNGLEALEQKFEAAKFNYLDPKRRSVA